MNLFVLWLVLMVTLCVGVRVLDSRAIDRSGYESKYLSVTVTRTTSVWQIWRKSAADISISFQGCEIAAYLNADADQVRAYITAVRHLSGRIDRGDES